jgi:hypothetical protein
VLVRRTPYEGFGYSHYLVVMQEEYVADSEDIGGDPMRLDRMVVTLPCSRKATDVLSTIPPGVLTHKGRGNFPNRLEQLVVAAVRAVGVVSLVVCDEDSGLALKPGEPLNQDPFGYRAERRSVAGPQLACFVRT